MHERQPNIVPEALAAPPVSEPASDTRAEKAAAAMAMLAEQTEAVLSSEGFTAWLRMQAKFHRYSVNNVLLIMAQKPDATLVNSYRRWQELGRHVRRGERGIQVFFPYKALVDELEPITKQPTGRTQEIVTGFGLGHVWDLSQTEGKPLPEPPAIADPERSHEVAAEVNRRASLWLIGQGVRTESRPIRGAANGYYTPTTTPKGVVIREAPGWADPLSVGRTRTLLHETAHFIADHRGTVDRGDAETVAEASAFVALAHWDLDPSQYSPHYIASWSKDKDTLRRNMGEVQRVSNILISAIEGENPTSAEEWL